MPVKRGNKILFFLLYLWATWHAFALLTYPYQWKALFHQKHLAEPLVDVYAHYLRFYPSWAFFYYIPEENIWVQYFTDDDRDSVKNFFSVQGGFSQRLRSYRCTSCSNAAYQFYFRKTPPSQKWLLGYFLCQLEPTADTITTRLGAAPFQSPSYVPVKEVTLSCQDYR